MFLPTKLKQGPQGTKLLQDYKKGGVQQAKQLTGTVAAFPAGAPGAAVAGVGVGVGVGSLVKTLQPQTQVQSLGQLWLLVVSTELRSLRFYW